jgi:hypothetical protein
MGKNDFTTMKFIDLSRQDQIDVLDRVSGELNIRQKEVAEQWREDYENMRLYMIYGESVPFDTLIEQLAELQTRIRSIKQ